MLPDTIGGLTALTDLHLAQCLCLTALPEAIGKLEALVALNLAGCKSLTALPAVIGGLDALATLDLSSCPSLTALPPRIEAMTQLEVKGWERLGLARTLRFVKLARPSVKAEHPELADEVIAGIISDYWGVISESHRAKFDDPHNGEAYGVLLVTSLIKFCKGRKRRECDVCGRRGTLEEDRFPVCWCGARRYCGEECQKADWAAGHSRACASGATWSAEDLAELRALRLNLTDIYHYATKGPLSGASGVRLYELEDRKGQLAVKNPPPADRER